MRKRQAEAGDIVLFYGDESEAPTQPYLTHPYLARAWAKSGANMRVLGTRSSQKVAIMGSLTYLSRELTIHTSLTKPSRDFIAHLDVSFQQVVHSVRIGASRGDWSYHTSKLQERAK